MDDQTLRSLLDDVSAGRVAVAEAATRLSKLPFADLGFARVDHHRGLRQGMAETVYAPGKTPAQCVAIVAELLANGTGPVLLTRADDAQLTALSEACPNGEIFGRTAVWRRAPPRRASVVIAAAGTADHLVAAECEAVLHAHGVEADRLDDIGVAGLHRLLASLDRVIGVDAVVVVAGMEGALASVLGGLVDCPVVAVPTSVGYGASFEGVTALLAMVASCAAGVSVVGIDNGYGAACVVLRQLRVLDRWTRP